MTAGRAGNGERVSHVVLRADGASRGNPGPAAAGVVVEAPDGTVLQSFGRRLGHMTNNAAEYRALLLGLEACRGLGARRVELRLDSELVVRQLSGEYRVKEPTLAPLHAEALQALGQFDGWTVRHVPRAENGAADRLANAALDAVGGAAAGAAGDVESLLKSVADTAAEVETAFAESGGTAQAVGAGREAIGAALERLRERVDAALRALGRG